MARVKLATVITGLTAVIAVFFAITLSILALTQPGYNSDKFLFLGLLVLGLLAIARLGQFLLERE